MLAPQKGRFVTAHRPVQPMRGQPSPFRSHAPENRDLLGARAIVERHRASIARAVSPARPADPSPAPHRSGAGVIRRRGRRRSSRSRASSAGAAATLPVSPLTCARGSAENANESTAVGSLAAENDGVREADALRDPRPFVLDDPLHRHDHGRPMPFVPLYDERERRRDRQIRRAETRFPVIADHSRLEFVADEKNRARYIGVRHRCNARATPRSAARGSSRAPHRGGS